MIDDKKNIDLLFSEGLKGLHAKAPPSSWSNLSAGLDSIGRKRKIFYFRLAAAAILLLMAFGSGFFYAIYYQSIQMVAADYQNVAEEPSDVVSAIISPNHSDDMEYNLDEALIAESFTRDNGRKHGAIVRQNQEPALLMEKPEATDPIHTMRSIASISVTTEKSVIEHYPIFKEESTQIAETPEEIIPDHHPLNLYVYDDLIQNNRTGQITFSVGPQAAPTYSFRDISTNYSYAGVGGPDKTNELNQVEDPLLSFSAGVNIKIKTAGRWGLQSGVYYAQIGQVNKSAMNFEFSDNQYNLVSVSTSTGSIDIAFDKVPDDVKKVNQSKDGTNDYEFTDVLLIQQFNLIEVPFLVNFRLFNSRFFVDFTGGLSPAYIVANNSWLETEDIKRNIGIAPNLNPFIINSSLGIGLGYDVSQKVSLNFEPVFRYSLNPINQGGEVYYHPYYLSVFTGLSYKF